GADGGETQAVTSWWAGERARGARTAPRSPSSATPGPDTRRRRGSSIHAPRARARGGSMALAVLLAALVCADRAKAAEDSGFDAKLRDRITRGAALGERLTEREDLERFYKDRGGRPA